MELEDTFKMFVGGYYGILEMDEYSTKEYVLKEIEEYIRNFITEYPIKNYDYKMEAQEIENLPLIRKLQDSILVLNKINGPMELILLIRNRLKELGS